MISISYAITVCNEIDELTKLLNFLQLHIREENHTIVSFPLNKDFASFKNNLKSYCTKDYVFQIDADEIPHEALIEYLPQVLETNPVDVVFVPRVNTVEGITQHHIFKWGWRVNEKGWVNFPDYQMRIYKRTDEVQWMNKVHERITGYTTFSNFPAEEHWSLYHPKEIERQEKQNEFYETI